MWRGRGEGKPGREPAVTNQQLEGGQVRGRGAEPPVALKGIYSSGVLWSGV